MFTKGESGNPNGRPSGAENKLTKDARKLFVMTLEDQVPNIAAAFEEVRGNDPAKYLELLAKYAQYFVPKMVDVKMSGNIINVVAPDKKRNHDSSNQSTNTSGEINEGN